MESFIRIYGEFHKDIWRLESFIRTYGDWRAS
jgi:hypothetical protein